ncbi:cation-translocating P-type ATPase [Parachlamydia sp. AcF125]|uniref:heavy metal translocating P-type ATPase n=1 Tax=Parachlamydia sp. AcF125 TaxID=2795736 RepID=UPI001BC9A415|nr:cation-translocating P-type ATPase [Parachlamydia sp. AcF125]MBS4167988.1 Cadmium-transporting ATPase [Parachlamydia sp. AcF125]
MLRDKKFVWLLIICCLVGILEFLSLAHIHLPVHIEIPVLTLIILGIGYQTLWHGFKALITFDFKNINALMLIAVCGAFYLGKYEEAAVVIVLYTLAEKLEDIGIEKSQSALGALIDKMPKVVSLKQNNLQVPIDQVKVGEIILIRPSDLIPLDGKVVAGNSYVDETSITGEPIPKDKFPGDPVFAGTLNKQGVLEVEVTKAAQDTTFAKIKELTFQATQVKANTQKFIEKFSQYYTPFIIVIAFFLVFIPIAFYNEPFDTWLLRGLALIVIACPCALVISTPVSIYSAIGNASSQGALIKGGRFLEAIGQIKAIALDKTRTLTYGQPVVTDIIPFGNHSKEHLLECAAGIEIFSEHPLAQSIVNAAKEEKLSLHAVKNFQSVVGKGAKADCLVCGDTHHCIGKLPFILEEHTVPQEVVEVVENLQKQGKTSIVIATHQAVEGVIALADRIRPESKPLVEGLKQLRIQPIMLTGDHPSPAKITAEEVGIPEVKASLLPEDKASAIRDLIYKYETVAMVGDGVNDAPALALSNVGISIGSLGSDAALEAASIVLLNDRLDVIPYLVKLGRRTIRTIQFNTALAIFIKLIFIALALFGMSNLALAIFADVGVTLIVMLISLRLSK